MSMPQFMFEPIEPHLGVRDRVREYFYKRKLAAARLNAAREKTLAAYNAYQSVGNRRDGSATIKHHKLVMAVADQLKEELAK